jgi:hypothetical protein
MHRSTHARGRTTATTTAFLALVVLVITVTAGARGATPIVRPAAAARAQAQTYWFWTPLQVANNLYYGGIHWGDGRVDTHPSATCWGLGQLYNPSDTVRRYHHFFCNIRPQSRKKAPYALVLIPLNSGSNLHGINLFANYDGPVTKQPWTWDPQSMANTLLTNGINWPQANPPRHDALSADWCQPFGHQYPGPQYPHFYCIVDGSNGSEYAVIATLNDATHYHVTYVIDDHALDPQATSNEYYGNLANNQFLKEQHTYMNERKFGKPCVPAGVNVVITPNNC